MVYLPVGLSKVLTVILSPSQFLTVCRDVRVRLGTIFFFKDDFNVSSIFPVTDKTIYLKFRISSYDFFPAIKQLCGSVADFFFNFVRFWLFYYNPCLPGTTVIWVTTIRLFRCAKKWSAVNERMSNYCYGSLNINYLLWKKVYRFTVICGFLGGRIKWFRVPARDEVIICPASKF